MDSVEPEHRWKCENNRDEAIQFQSSKNNSQAEKTLTELSLKIAKRIMFSSHKVRLLGDMCVNYTHYFYKH